MADSATPLSNAVHAERTEIVEDVLRLASFSPQDVSPQTLELDSFFYFPKLPIELRLHVWRYTFPSGKYICFDVGMETIMNGNKCRPAGSDVTRSRDFELKRPLPVTLAVCAESRKETLRHYLLFCRPSPAYSDPANVPHPFCFNPTRDVAYIVKTNLWPIHYNEWQEVALPSAKLEGIRTLEIRDWFWTGVVGKELEDACRDYKKFPKGSFFDRILSFPDLSKITFMWAEKWYRTPNKHEVQQLQMNTEEGVRKYLEFHKDHWKGRMPTIEVVGWSPLRELA